MGMFSYSCTKCGDKAQHDWANCCVLKIGGVYVRGYYQMYGGVKIQVATKDGKETTVMAYHEQFREYFDCWDLSSDALLATEIYCDGDGDQDELILLCQFRGAERAAMLSSLTKGGRQEEEGDGSERFCAPEGIAILDILDESMLEDLPKAVPSKENTKDTGTDTKKHANDDGIKGKADEAPKPKKAKSAKI